MSNTEEIFSLRLVMADFYMEKPVAGLDTCYSEFRGKEIKKVPIIRIFGSNSLGQKTCMHVHGVFPYFYIPYDQDFQSLNQAIYQIAINLDKAINISLSQGSSSAQHVFKVQLVKGIPFYGYHRSHHQFLKIYMFNPRFVRRAANLLQNGAILNKNFHPHESHVPYILQFMIDYNLYGMSFLHVPLEIVKFRTSGNAEDKVPLENIRTAQVLDSNLVKKISCSSLEIDIGSNFILNRFQLITKTNATHSNPGIESIWHDERLRRQKLAQFADGENVNAIPPLEVPSTQERPDAQPTESELFYRTGLLSQLLARETSMIESTLLSNQTLSSNNISNTALNLNKPQKKTFNLTKILQNFVYPEECTQNDNIINASFIPNHLSNNNMFEQSVLIKSNEGIDQEEKKTSLDETIFMDDTIVDEDLVLSLTESQYHKTQDQHHHVPLNATLRDEDMELLSILQQLEENNDDKIDLDSTLAPVSQNQTNIDDLDKNTKTTVESDFDEDADEDGNLLDFSIALENFDDLILKLTQSQEKSHSSNHKFDTDMPQVDGANDLLRTPTKSSKRIIEKSPPCTPTTPKNRRLTTTSPRRSPRTPKTSHKYAPLPLVSLNRSAIKSAVVNNCNEVTPLKRNTTDKNSLPATSLRKNLALFDLRRKSISVDSNLQEHSTALKEMRSRKHSKKSVNLDKTHITCSLTPRKSNEKFLKVYSIEKCVKPLNGNNKDLANKLIEDEVDTPLNNNNQEKSKALTSKVLKANKTKSDVENQTHCNYLKKSKEQLVSKPSTSKTACKKNDIASEFTKQWELKKSLDIFQKNLKKNDVNDLENLEKNSCSSENDEEIVDSDNNSELSLENVTGAPYSKRLRRSFRSSISDKNKSVAETPIIISSDLSSSKDTSTLCTNVENKVIKNVKLNFKKCKVKLKRIEDTVLGTHKFAKNKTEDKRMEKQKVSSTITSKEKQSENISSHKMLANFDENSTLMKSAPITSTHFAEADIFTKSSSIIPNKSKLSKNTLRTHKDYLEKDEQTLSQNLKNLQKALKLHLQSAEAIDRSNLVLSSDVFSYSSSNERSGVEITETPPPQESNQLLKHSHIYKKSFELALQSPTLFSQSSSPLLLANEELKNTKTSSGSTLMESECCITLSSASNHSLITPETKLVLTPLDLPPSREEVIKGCLKLQIPEYDFQQPFYSNPDDITKHKELGFTILQIPGNKLNDIEEFQSVLGTDLKGLTTWRREQLIQLGGVEMLNKYRNTQSIREYFSSQKSVVITPQLKVPSRQETKLWLKAREVLTNKEEHLDELNVKNIEEDSPIKIRRQKVTMTLNAPINNDDSDESLNCTSESLILTPLTPATPDLKEDKAKDEIKRSFIPVTRGTGSTSLKRDMTFKKRNNCRILRRVSLNKQFKEAFEKEVRSNSKKLSQEATTIKESQILPGSQTSDTSVSNETALAELEKSSFMRHLKEFDATMGGFTENSTLNNSFGFKVALENLQQAKSDVEFNYLTIITLEIFVATREDLLPNPELDEIRCLFYAIENSIPNDHIEVGQKLPGKACGYIMVHDHRDIVGKEGRIHGIDVDIEVTIVQTEVEALEALLNLCARWDPDIYAGYEIEMSSWGFVIERAKYLCFNIAPLLSRVPTQKVRDFVDEDRESFTDLDVEMKLCGRILLDVWRLLRSEIALTSYTFENVMYHIMHKRCPWHSHRNLTEWFASPCSRWIVIEYYLERVKGTLALLDQLDIIGRTSEMAKLIGIQFYEVLSRGSQFRVESMMLRIAKPKNLVPLSPSVQQRAHMRAPEYLPLIMEPQSRFYADPMIVLDFQSLYPSMIMAYNYCFSTCLGRVEHLGQSTPFEFGASKLRVSPTMLRKLIDDDLITISPCGVVFVKSSVRGGILPVMLTEILNTRQMVKQSMKLHKSNSALQRILHSRQLGLKLMANVTYGYTAANYSGRMPAVEVGDSVVSKGRETLERAIKMVEDNDKWNVKVVYGDTDSMFVLVPGRNRDEAFRIGEEIAEAVTKQNPHPVKLKLEKVYQPCILQTKKRYVGYMYETADQKEPVYEAKGIETVRRDGCPIVPKMLEKVLRILFESADVSLVKHYVCRQFTKILSGRANLQDLIFAKEFRGLNGYRPTACVPALELTRKWIQTDPRRVPRRGERVPFVITNGPPGVPLIRLVHHPHEILSDEGLKVNAIYYITKAIIPPLNRCLLLIGADVNEWFASLPRKILLTPAFSTFNEVASCLSSRSKKSTISQFFSTSNCIADCGRQTKHSICAECSKNSTRSVVILQTKISKIERSYLTTQHICQACCGRVGDLECGSLDCPVMFVLEVKRRELQQSICFRKLIEEKF